jgi:anthranilate phosphoribosyltransferase
MDFSGYTRTIGRGPTLSRPLTREEARDAMGMVLDGLVEPVQLGGFLLVLRQRGETAEEIAGFVDALRDRLDRPTNPIIPDVDWPSYADHHRQQPWFILSARLLAAYGITVLMHGIDGAGTGDGCAPSRPVLDALALAQRGVIRHGPRRPCLYRAGAHVAGG